MGQDTEGKNEEKKREQFSAQCFYGVSKGTKKGVGNEEVRMSFQSSDSKKNREKGVSQRANLLRRKHETNRGGKRSTRTLTKFFKEADRKEEKEEGPLPDPNTRLKANRMVERSPGGKKIPGCGMKRKKGR